MRKIRCSRSFNVCMVYNTAHLSWRNTDTTTCMNVSRYLDRIDQRELDAEVYPRTPWASALALAVHIDKYEVVKLLLEAGASSKGIYPQARSGFKLLLLLVKHGYDLSEKCIQWATAQYSKTRMSIVLTLGARPNKSDLRFMEYYRAHQIYDMRGALFSFTKRSRSKTKK